MREPSTANLHSKEKEGKGKGKGNTVTVGLAGKERGKRRNGKGPL